MAGDGSKAVLVLGFESTDHPVEHAMARALEICAEHAGESARPDAARAAGDAVGSWREAFLGAPYLRDSLVAVGVLGETFETAITWERFGAFHAQVIAAAEQAMREVVRRRGPCLLPLHPRLPRWARAVLHGAGAALAAATRSSSGARSSTRSRRRSSPQGGTITHHHAVGRDHRPWYDRQRPEPFAAALGGAKAALDPAGVLNPGVLIAAATMKVAVLGPGGVGGLVAGALVRAGTDATIIARESTAAVIDERGLRVNSVLLGDFVSHAAAVAELREPVDALIVATKAAGLEAALERVERRPAARATAAQRPRSPRGPARALPPARCSRGPIRVEADRPEPGVIVQTSPFLRVDMASSDPALASAMERLAASLSDAGVPARTLSSEAEVMWSKLVRLNALACTTSAYDKLLGEIRSTPALRAELVGAIEEASAVARAEGAESIDAATAIGELEQAHDTLGSSMQRDIAAGRAPELDAIPGSVLRAGARHGIACPTIEALVVKIAARIGAEPPIPSAS